MQKLAFVLVSLFAQLSVAYSQDSSDEQIAVRKAEVKRLAKQVGEATLRGDAKAIMALTYDPLVEFMGGKEKAIATTDRMFSIMKTQGMSFKSFETGEPKSFTERAGHYYIVVPTEVRLASSAGVIGGPSYLLAISVDEMKTWKFLDGTGLANEQLKAKLLPQLPKDLELPEQVEPKLIK